MPIPVYLSYVCEYKKYVLPKKRKGKRERQKREEEEDGVESDTLPNYTKRLKL